MTLDALRALFPHTEHTVYLAHAAVAPLSRPVKTAMQAFIADRHGERIDNFETFAPVMDETRARLARLLGTDTGRVAFAPNTSYGLGVLAEGLRWEPGDRVAVPGCEFPANVYPFMNLERRGVSVDLIPHKEGTFTVEDVERTLTPQTRLVSLSWVQFLSGFRADLAAIGALCRSRGVLLCVDAIQGLGALQMDVEALGVDFLASGGHKWLMAPQGIGLLYLTEAVQARIDPPAGWLHGPVDWDDFYSYELAFHPDATRFHIGMLNGVGIAGLHAALGVREAVGETAERAVLARARALSDGLERLGLERYGTADPAHASGIVTVRHPDPEGALARLKSDGVAVSLRNRLLRFAPTYYNTEGEIERALAATAAA